MQLTSATLLVAGLAAQQASAHFPWALDAGKFSTCSNADTQCSTEQHKGYDWTGLTIGHPVTSYGANTFSGGWTCNSIKSKRDELTKRTFNNKCVSGKLPSWGSSGSSNHGAGSLSIGCSGEKNKFSISEMHISSTYNTNVDCHYNMPDGSICKHNVPCQAGGSIIKNTQCGGAISVSFSHGKPSSGSPSSNKGDCNLNIHSVGFACGSGSSSTSVSLPSSVLIPSSSAVYSSSEFVSFSTASPETTSSEVTSETTSSQVIPETTSAELPSSIPTSDTLRSTVIMSSGSVVIPGSSAPFPTGYQNQTTTQPTIGSSSEASPVESTSSSVVVPISTGYYPSAASSVIVPVGTGSSPSSSVIIPVGTGSFPSSSTGVYANSTVVSSALTSSAASPAPSADCPGVVPSCLNTYLHNTQCANNADADCYCKDEDFINSVYQCIDAYGGSDENVSQAMSYMVGICAQAIPSNPAIITAVPSSIDIQPSSSTVNAATGSLSSAVPVGSVTSDIPAGSLTSEVPASSATDSIVYVTDVVKSTVTTCPVGETITASGSTTVLTAPSVVPTVYTTKSTITASIISSVTGALPSGESPYETSPVQTSPAGASSSEISPAETTSSASVHVQVPHTVTLFSTQIATITSCAPEITNCPATLSTSLIPTGSTTSNIWIPVTSAQETQPAASSGVYSGVVSSAVEVPATSAQETSPAQTASVGTSSGISSGISSGVLSSSVEVPSASSPASSGAYETSPAETTPAVSSAPSVPKTVTLFSTKIDTITSCAADITNCPARVSTSLIATGVTTAPAAYETDAVPAQVQSIVIVTDVVKTTITTCPVGETVTASGKTTVLTAPSVITSQITIKSTISTTVPAQTQTVVSPESSSADAVMPSSAAVTSAPQTPKTLTIYSSVVATITSCAPDVKDCPASSTVQSTSFYAVGTTVSEAPIVPGPSEVAPATTAPAVVPSSSTQPMTTITYSSELVIPCTYTAGESRGATIPNSMTTSTIHRTLTVPQVQFITSTVGGKPSVGLTYPSAVPATTTPEAMPTSSAADAATPAVSAPAVAASSSGFSPAGSAASSGFAPKSSTLASTYNTPALPTGSPISYTGAGAKVGGSFAGLALAAVAAIFVL